MSSLGFLIHTVQDIHITNLNAVAITALTAYEIMITSGQEVNCIWRSRWCLVKILYLIIRYYAMFFLLTNSFVVNNAFMSQNACRYYKNFLIWGNFIIWPLVDCVIVLRIYALYGRDKKMGFALAGLWLSETITCLTLLGFAWAPFDAIPNPLPGVLTGCLLNYSIRSSPTYALSFTFWTVTSGFQAVYVGLTLFKLVGVVRTHGITKSATTPLVTVFFRDGAAYFLIILASILLNILIERFGSIFLSEAGSLWTMAIPSITACRLVLNIRDVRNTPTTPLGSHRDILPIANSELCERRFHIHSPRNSRTGTLMHRYPTTPPADV